MRSAGARRWWALGAITLGVLAVGLDGTVLSVVLPTLASALHASESDLQWFSSGYALVLAAGMLPAGLLGDRYGRKKVLVGSILLFGLGSTACAYAPSPAAFIAARAVLGLAGSGLVTMALSSMTVLFSEEERPRAVGVWAAANFLALPVGPILGGWLVANYWWGWVFLLNVPVALVGLLAVVALVPESRSPQRPGLDPLGVVASSLGLAAITYGLIEAGGHGWGDASALVPLAFGGLTIVGFLVWERRLTDRSGGQPLVDLSLFRSANFTWGTLLAGAGIFAMVGVLFTMPQYFQAILGTDAQGSGLRLLPLIGGVVVGAVPADRLAEWLGRKVVVSAGFVVLAAGAFIGAQSSAGSGDAFIAAWMAIVGAGMGLALATASSGALVEVSAERSGVGAAVMQAVQKVGAPFGAAILGSVLSATYQGRLALGGVPAEVAAAAKSSVFAGTEVARQLSSTTLLDSVRSSFVSGVDAALLVSAGVALASAAIAVVFLPRRSAAAESMPARGAELSHERVA